MGSLVSEKESEEGLQLGSGHSCGQGSACPVTSPLGKVGDGRGLVQNQEMDQACSVWREAWEPVLLACGALPSVFQNPTWLGGKSARLSLCVTTCYALNCVPPKSIC